MTRYTKGKQKRPIPKTPKKQNKVQSKPDSDMTQMLELFKREFKNNYD